MAKLDINTETPALLLQYQAQLMNSLMASNHLFCQNDEEADLVSFGLLLAYMISSRQTILSNEKEGTSGWNDAFLKLELAKCRFASFLEEKWAKLKPVLKANEQKLSSLLAFAALSMNEKGDLWNDMVANFKMPEVAEYEDKNWQLFVSIELCNMFNATKTSEIDWDKALCTEFGKMRL